jgi:predicted dehydrogenase
MTNDPRLCIVGAGGHATRRIYPYIGAAGAELVGVCDLVRERAETNARRFGGRVYTNVEAMIAAERPDGVILCLGPEGHASVAPMTLRLGVPTYTEKPPAPTAEAALAVARVAKETGVLCTTGFKKRYSVAYVRARRWVDAFAPSDLYSLSFDYGSAHYANDSPRSSFLLDFAIHAIDLIAYLFGDVAEVFAFSKGQDAYAVSVRFVSGAVGSLNLNDGRSFGIPTEEVELTARGANWMTISNSSRWRIVENGKPTEWREPPTFTSAGDSGYDTGHLAELADFTDALRTGRTTTRSHIGESYKSMALYEAIRDAAETGRVVTVHYDTP